MKNIYSVNSFSGTKQKNYNIYIIFAHYIEF
jgi:hypothetical protein